MMGRQETKSRSVVYGAHPPQTAGYTSLNNHIFSYIYTVGWVEMTCFSNFEKLTGIMLQGGPRMNVKFFSDFSVKVKSLPMKPENFCSDPI